MPRALCGPAPTGRRFQQIAHLDVAACPEEGLKLRSKKSSLDLGEQIFIERRRLEIGFRAVVQIDLTCHVEYRSIGEVKLLDASWSRSCHCGSGVALTRPSVPPCFLVEAPPSLPRLLHGQQPVEVYRQQTDRGLIPAAPGFLLLRACKIGTPSIAAMDHLHANHGGTF